LRQLSDDTLLVFVSDSHVGGDGGRDIFESPDELKALFDELAAHAGPVELVLAGDFFDFLRITERPARSNPASLHPWTLAATCFGSSPVVGFQGRRSLTESASCQIQRPPQWPIASGSPRSVRPGDRCRRSALTPPACVSRASGYPYLRYRGAFYPVPMALVHQRVLFAQTAIASGSVTAKWRSPATRAATSVEACTPTPRLRPLPPPAQLSGAIPVP
jgi:hypothetical protein